MYHTQEYMVNKLKLKDLLIEKGSLPVSIDQIKGKGITAKKRVKNTPGSEAGDDFTDHHKHHNGAHIMGYPAEDDTYDWDDENDDKEGGLQNDKDTSKRGYEPVKKFGQQVKEFKNKFEKRMYDLISEESVTNAGSNGRGNGLIPGDSWPDGIFTKYGETRLITPASMPRGMKQLVAPAADSIYGGDGSKREKPSFVTRTKVTPEYTKSNEVIDPHELRDDTPPLSPKQRVYGRRAFGKSPDYIIPKESHNFSHTAKNILVKPTTPPEGTKSGGIPATPEPGSPTKSGYRRVQKGGQSVIHDLDPLYILKQMGKYDPNKE